MSQSMVHEPRDSRSIEESLALIQHHVKVTFSMVNVSSVFQSPGSERVSDVRRGASTSPLRAASSNTRWLSLSRALPRSSSRILRL